ncbi:MAG: hypothetical protein ACI906_004789 [Candidatus Latescibacterota bacterium]|jgi:hypothetical protein
MTKNVKDKGGYAYSDFLLDATKMSFSRSENGNLILHLDGETYNDLNIRRAFPLEKGDRYIGFFTSDRSELGLLEDPSELEENSRRELLAELDKIYFRPRITAFNSLDEEFGVLRGEIETTSGPRPLEIRGFRQNVRMLSNNRAIIEDVDGNRYIVEDWPSLPQRIREILGL